MILPIRRRRAGNKQTKAEGSSCGAGARCAAGGGARQGTPLSGDLLRVGTHTSSVFPVHGDKAMWVYGSWSRAITQQPANSPVWGLMEAPSSSAPSPDALHVPSGCICHPKGECHTSVPPLCLSGS